eukprot:GAHX01000371.1.p1 GENE.GAHX01000371.1~~GAHX01000371.1.p1  ORF type:complete len:147 (+),score=27.74 GAHX01000371.1:41-481(+)
MAKTSAKEPKEKLRKLSYRGVGEEELKVMKNADFIQYLPATRRRRFKKGISEDYKKVIQKAKKRKEEAVGTNAPPKLIKTHCRDAIVLPSMLGCTFGVYNGRDFIEFEADIPKLGCHFGWFSPTRKPVHHGKGDSKEKEIYWIPYK